MKKIIIDGMMCNHCRGSVEKALNAIDGVTANVSLEEKCAYVEGNAEDSVLKSAIEALGFKVLGTE